MSNERQLPNFPPLYATAGPAGWALAYELAALLARGTPEASPQAWPGSFAGAEEEGAPSPRLDVLLVDAEGYVNDNSPAQDPPTLLRDSNQGLHVLAYPGLGQDQEDSVARASGIRACLAPHFDVLVVCCGNSPYGRGWQPPTGSSCALPPLRWKLR